MEKKRVEKKIGENKHTFFGKLLILSRCIRKTIFKLKMSFKINNLKCVSKKYMSYEIKKKKFLSITDFSHFSHYKIVTSSLFIWP